METRTNKKNAPTYIYCKFPGEDYVRTCIEDDFDADIRDCKAWMKAAKIRLSPKRKKALEECLDK